MISNADADAYHLRGPSKMRCVRPRMGCTSMVSLARVKRVKCEPLRWKLQFITHALGKPILQVHLNQLSRIKIRKLQFECFYRLNSRAAPSTVTTFITTRFIRPNADITE